MAGHPIEPKILARHAAWIQAKAELDKALATFSGEEEAFHKAQTAIINFTAEIEDEGMFD